MLAKIFRNFFHMYCNLQSMTNVIMLDEKVLQVNLEAIGDLFDYDDFCLNQACTKIVKAVCLG